MGILRKIKKQMIKAKVYGKVDNKLLSKLKVAVKKKGKENDKSIRKV